MSPECHPSVSRSAPVSVNEDDASVDPVEFLLRPSSTPDNPTGRRVLEVAQVIGDAVSDVRQYLPGSEVQVADRPPNVTGADRGTATAFSAPRELLFDDAVTLCHHTPEGWMVSFHERWGGFLVRGDSRVGLAELIANGLARRVTNGTFVYPLGAGERFVIDLGATAFVVREAVAARRVVGRIRDEVDHGAAAIVTFISLSALLIGTAMGFIPPAPEVSALELQDRVVNTDLFRQIIPPPTPTANTQQRPDQPKAAARAAGAEGRRGGGSPRGQAVKDLGLLDALNNNPDLVGISSGTLDGGIRRGIDGLIGSSGASNGPGLGDRGNGLGNNGRVRDADGLSLTGDRTGARNLAIGGHGAKPERGIPLSDEAITIGHYDRSLVDAVIKRHIAEIRYCYSRELVRTPTLAGKVTVKFTIDGTGAVSSAITKSSTLGSPAAESCINGRILRLTFPEPAANGLVVVSYPFMFTTS